MSGLPFPDRPDALHKGSAGRLLIVGGSPRYPGAPQFAARAALRAGAGLVTLGLAAPLTSQIGGRLAEAIVLSLPVDERGLIEPLRALVAIDGERADALLVGPGLPLDPATADLARRLVLTDGAPLVLDAGALSSLAEEPGVFDWEPARPLVLTPHVGEFLAISGAQQVDEQTVLGFARSAQAVVVCKGSSTLIAAPDGRVERLGRPNPLLATGGTGDVLAGLLGALLAAGLAPYEAASLAVAWHAAAGERLAARLGRAGLLASELADELPLVRQELA